MYSNNKKKCFKERKSLLSNNYGFEYSKKQAKREFSSVHKYFFPSGIKNTK